MPIEAFVRENWSHAVDYDGKDPEQALYSVFTLQMALVDCPGLGLVWIHPRMHPWRVRSDV